MGLVDGLLLAGLTLETDGFESTLFWVYPGLIIVNALSIPLATPQIVLNLSLSGLYLSAGLLLHRGHGKSQHHLHHAALCGKNICGQPLFEPRHH